MPGKLYILRLINLENRIAGDYTKLATLEKFVHVGHHHGRQWKIELDGIPMEIGDESTNLKIAVLKILDAINVSCTSDDIQAIPRLSV